MTKEANIVKKIDSPAREIILKANLAKATEKEYCFLSEGEECFQKGKLYLAPDGKAVLYRICSTEDKIENCSESIFPVYSEDKISDLYSCDNIDKKGYCDNLKSRKHFVYDDFGNIIAQYNIVYTPALGKASMDSLSYFSYAGSGQQIYSKDCSDISEDGRCLDWEDPIVNYKELKPRVKNFKEPVGKNSLIGFAFKLISHRIYDEQGNFLIQMPRSPKLGAEIKTVPFNNGKKKIYCLLKPEDKCILTMEAVLDNYGLGKSLNYCRETNPDDTCKRHTRRKIFFYDGSGRRKSTGECVSKKEEDSCLPTKGEIYKYDKDDDLTSIIYCQKYDSSNGNCQEFDAGFTRVKGKWLFCNAFDEKGLCKKILWTYNSDNALKKSDITPPNIKYNLPDDERWTAVDRDDGIVEIRFNPKDKSEAETSTPLPEAMFYVYGDNDVELVYTLSKGVKRAQVYYISDKLGNYIDMKY